MISERRRPRDTMISRLISENKTIRNSEFPPWNFLYTDSDYDYYNDRESCMIIMTITNEMMIMITMLTMFIN